MKTATNIVFRGDAHVENLIKKTPPVLVQSGHTFVMSEAVAVLCVYEKMIDPDTYLLIASRDGDAIFSDLSLNNYPVVAHGGITHSLEASLFGNTAMKFDGIDSYLSVQGSLSATFTVECFFYATVLYGWVVSQWGNGDYSWGVKLQSATSLRFYYSSDGINLNNFNITSFTFSLNTWYHVAIVVDNGVVNIYVEGVLYGTIEVALHVSSHDILVGGYGSGIGLFTGFIEEVRVKKSVVYTGNPITIPSEAFAVSSDNWLLLNHGIDWIFDSDLKESLDDKGVGIKRLKDGSTQMSAFYI